MAGDAVKAGGIGKSVKRVEDRRLVTGRGAFTDDIAPKGAAHGYVLRSPHAHARLGRIDSTAAKRAPGVLAVLTAADLEAAGIKPLPTLTRAPGVAYKNRDGSDMPVPTYYPLARGKVRFAGEGVAFVIAETRAQAQDAAELIEVEYEPLPAVASYAQALAPGAALVWEESPGNRLFDWEQGDRAASDRVFAEAAHVTRLKLVNNRIIVNYLEPRAATGEYDAAAGRFTLTAGAQSVHQHRNGLALVLGQPPEKIRVVSRDVGGAFGCRTFLYPEYPLVCHAARLLGRPVRWRADRSEQFLSDQMGRDQTMDAALALDRDGRVLGIRVEAEHNIGAYVCGLAVYVIIVNMARMIPSAYAVPSSYFRLGGLYTNQAPINAYRGVGRAEAVYAFERLIDQAARETGVDRVELRRRNFVPPSAMPYKTPSGAIYDSGEFARIVEIAQEAAEWRGFPARRLTALKRGKLRGIGLSFYIEGAGGLPIEYARLRLDTDGTVTVFAGTQINGQGHETVFAQVASEQLGVPFETVRIVFGDSDRIAKGTGTFASRSMRMMGGAIMGAAKLLVESGKGAAAAALEAGVEDIEFAGGAYRIKGTDRAVALAKIAKAAGGLEGELEFNAAAGNFPGAALRDDARDDPNKTAPVTYPNGCHVCEVEIDPETGARAIVGYTVVDDVGRVVNPMLVHGQVQGGVAQGVGQALMEQAVYDRDTGQLVTGSFMDYGLPRADDFPEIRSETHEVLCKTNPIGVKGCGEGGATGAPPAVIAAILDALKPAGVAHIDMPATPEAIWRALNSA